MWVCFSILGVSMCVRLGVISVCVCVCVCVPAWQKLGGLASRTPGVYLFSILGVSVCVCVCICLVFWEC